MRLIAPIFFAGFLGLVLSGCGSNSYQSSARTAVSHLTDTFAGYNRAPQHDLTQTAAACRTAEAGISAARLPSAPSTGRFHAVGTSLAHAYTLARSGFANCASSAQHMNYPGMVRAQTELAGANTWLHHARAQDR